MKATATKGDTMIAKTKLTLDDLEQALAREDHLGWGYATRDAITDPSAVPPSRMARAERRLARLNEAVVAVANEIDLDAETLFHWTNSKWGRWLIDGVYGNDEKPTAETVRKYLNAKAVEQALDI